ncbi:MAG: DUF4350 domain-containing protein [Myxococcales bacterium]|nr:DUF4350 domain-containing protein [Myxococcales bacterium]
MPTPEGPRTTSTRVSPWAWTVASAGGAHEGAALAPGASVALVLVGAGAPAAAADARSVLADRRFGFCHDERYPLTEGEAAWCPLLPAADPICPAFRAACLAPRAEIDGAPGAVAAWRKGAPTAGGGEGRREGARRGPAGGRDDRRSADADTSASEGADKAPRTSPSPSSSPAPSGPSPTRARLADRRRHDRRPPRPAPRRRRPPRRPPPRAAEEDAEAPGGPLVAPPVDAARARRRRPPRRAEAHLRAGELEAAIADAHAALLHRLAERERIRLHPSLTNGDHVRALRGDPPLQDDLRRVVRVVERVHFGHAPIVRADAEGLLGQVRSAMSKIAGVLLLLWTGLACDDAPSYPWSHSPSGAAGVLELLRDRGLEVDYRLETLDALDPAGPSPIVVDGAELSEREWSALLDHVRGGGRALLAGFGDDLPAELEITPKARAGAQMPPLADDLVPGRALVIPGDRGLASTHEGAVVLRADADGVAYGVRIRLGDGLLVVLADDRLLTNGALAIPDNGEVLVGLVSALGDRVELVEGGVRDLAIEGGADDPFEAVARAHLTPAILQLLALALLLFLWRGAHVGRPQDPPPPSRRRFAEHVQALARHYERAGARRHALRLYAGWAMERIVERHGGGVGGGAPRGLHRLARRIAARTGQDETAVMRLLAEAQHAQSAPDDDHRGDAEDLRVLRELGDLVDPPAKRGERGER